MCSKSYRLYCAVYGCFNTSISNPELTFFKLPAPSERLTEWLQLMCRDDLEGKSNIKNYRICEKHFNAQDILPSPTRKVLKRNSLPSLNLPNLKSLVQGDVVGSCLQETKETQTANTLNESYAEASTSLSYNNPRKRKCMSENSEESTFHGLCDKLLPKELALLVKAQTNLNLQGKADRFDQDYIFFCLNLYFTCPQAYQLLKKVLCLPCATILSDHLITTKTEINDKTMSLLKIKVEKMSEAEKTCSVLIGTMTLKTNLFYDIKQDRIIGFREIDGWQSPDPARTALVIMVRGIFSNWKQPVAYALLSESQDNEINKWINKVLKNLFEIGLNVKTFTSDLRISAKNRLVSAQKPYFFMDGRKIYYIYDAPQLMKSVRDNFMQYNFYFENSVATYKHIVQFYNQDVKESNRLAQKLTDSHIKPTNIEKTKVVYAMQLFSKTVAEGISKYVYNEDIPESGSDTAKFILMMNNLFDSLNSFNFIHNYEYKGAYTGNELQNLFFRKMLSFFQELKLVDPNTGYECTANEKFIEGFQITITSIMLLFEDLRSEGHNFLFTRRLNHEPLVNLFDLIRKSAELSTNPTSRQFILAFKKLYISNIIKPVKGGKKGVDDFEKLFTQTFNKDLNRFVTPETSNTENFYSIQIESSEYNQLDIVENKSLYYICSYLLKSCSEKHRYCEAFEFYMKPFLKNYIFSTESRFVSYEDYSKNNSENLTMVPYDDFAEYIEEMDKIFRQHFQGKFKSHKVSESIFKEIEEIPFVSPCSCFPKKYLMKLFIRMRIFYTLKFNNTAFSTSRIKRFCVINL